MIQEQFAHQVKDFKGNFPLPRSLAANGRLTSGCCFPSRLITRATTCKPRGNAQGVLSLGRSLGRRPFAHLIRLSLGTVVLMLQLVYRKI